MKQKCAIVFLVFGVILFGCKTIGKSGLSLYSVEKHAEIIIKSSCKLSAVSHLKEDSAFKNSIEAESNKTIKQLKIKSEAEIEKSSYYINKTEFIITERCGAKTKDGNPFLGLQENIYLENIKTKEILTFHADTIVIQNQTLNAPKTIVPAKLNLTPYIGPLTNKIYLQIKKRLSK